MNSIQEVYEKINTCTACSLHKNRITDFIYRGNKEAKIILIGEAPGATEQEMGLPFVGRSGRLLDRLLIKSGLDPQNDVFISNIVKCRPTDNRKPFYDEILKCCSFLLREIELVKPSLIITLGKTSGDWFNNYKAYDINKYYKEKKWLPLYHPSYLLRRNNEIINWVAALKKVLKGEFNGFS
jgi:uracil-DNA glycosylase